MPKKRALTRRQQTWIAHTAVGPPKVPVLTPESWWATPACQQNRATFRAVLESRSAVRERITRVEDGKLNTMSQWRET